MPVTGVFFIPSNPNSPPAGPAVTERLKEVYNPTVIGRWALEHKLLRDTPSCLPFSAYEPLPPLQPRFMQFLSLTHFSTHGFIYTSERPDPHPWEQATSTAGSKPPGSTLGTPSFSTSASPPGTQSTASSFNQASGSSQSMTLHPPEPLPMIMATTDPISLATMFQMSVKTSEPLWNHRHTVGVPVGTLYEAGDFRVRIGDVRQTFPAARPRGTVVEIEYRGPSSASTLLSRSDADVVMSGDGAGVNAGAATTEGEMDLDDIVTNEDWDVGEMLIQEFWDRIKVDGAKEALRVPGLGKETPERIARRKKDARRKRTGPKSGEVKGQGGSSHDPFAGMDLARQYMEVFRFHR